MEIRSLDELLVYGANVISGIVEYEPVEIVGDAIDFNIVVRGDTWDKKVDIRSARYVLQLSDALRELAEDVDIDVDMRKALVKIDFRDGSGDWLGDIKDFACKVFTPMTSKQTFITTLIGIAAATGVSLAYIDSTGRTTELHERTKIEAINTIKTLAEQNRAIVAQYEKPVKQLVSSLDDRDTIQVFGSDIVSKSEAKKMLLKQVRSRETTAYADGDYTLTDINFKQGELILFLEQDGIGFKAYTAQLSDEDRNKLFDSIKEKQNEEDLPFQIKIQLNIHYTNKKILFGSIIGLGDARDGRTHLQVSQLPISN